MTCDWGRHINSTSECPKESIETIIIQDGPEHRVFMLCEDHSTLVHHGDTPRVGGRIGELGELGSETMTRAPCDLEARFAERARIIRIYQRMNQGALADAIGLDPSALRNIEAGRRTVRLSEAVEICRVLGLDLYQMISDEPFAYQTLVMK